MSYHSWPAEGGGGGGGSAFWGDSVPNSGALPAGAVIGELRQTLDTMSIWRWTGLIWEIYLDYPGEIAKLVGVTGVIQDQFDAITTDITALDTDLDTAESAIDALEAQDIVIDGQINALDGRIDVLEAFNLDPRVDALEAYDVVLDGRLDTLEGQNLNTRLLGAESDIDILQAYDTTLTGRVTALEGDRVLKAGDTMTGALILHADPSTGLQAATKQYADNLANGQKWKLAARLASTANIASLTGTPTIDGVLAVIGDRILLKDQSTASDNGIYICAAGAWTRATDTDTFSELNSASVMVSEGTQNGDKGFYQTAELTSLASNQTWIQNFGSGLYAADEVTLQLVGKTFSIKDNGVDLTGAKVTGALPIAKGGTGQASAPAALNALLPTQTSNSKKVLQTDGTNVSFAPLGLPGVLATANVSPAVVTTAYLCTSTGGFTITLPTIPAEGGVIEIIDAGETCSATNFIRVAPASGQSLDGYLANDTLTLDYARAHITAIAAPGATSWKIKYQVVSAYTVRAPTVQKFTSGSGTYTTPTGVAWIRVRMVGGGGGGGGSGSAGGSNGGAGGNSSFGTSLLVANGGGGGARWDANSGGAGGTASLGTGPIGSAVSGSNGGFGGYSTGTGTYSIGGGGGTSPFGGGGGSLSAATNSGSGGGGGNSGGSVANMGGGGGGGAGGFIDAIISTPLTSYAYAVGAAGTAGTAGSNGSAGGAGAAGQIIVEEYYY